MLSGSLREFDEDLGIRIDGRPAVHFDADEHLAPGKVIYGHDVALLTGRVAKPEGGVAEARYHEIGDSGDGELAVDSAFDPADLVKLALLPQNPSIVEGESP